MIAYPIGDPIRSHRVHPNRPRIARIGPSRFVSFNYVLQVAIPTYDARRAAMR